MTKPIPAVSHSDETVLVVDLDGSLLSTDTGWESLAKLIHSRPAALLALPVWLGKGLSFLKDRLAQVANPDPASLPYNEKVLQFIRDEHDSGRTVILATATNSRIAERVADHLGFFADVVASDQSTNLHGEAKLEAIRSLIGDGTPFDYIGDSVRDVPIWKAARRAYVVARNGQPPRGIANAIRYEHVFAGPKSTWRTYVRALRVHQWVKNLLLFVPLLLAHRMTDVGTLISTAIAFGAFSLCASSVYVANDIVDLSNDRLHPRKKFRPLANGTFHLRSAAILAPVLLAAGLTISYVSLPIDFTLLLILYLLLTSVYSLYLKRVPILDVLVLAGLYTLRLFAGGSAAEVVISPWLTAFSLFFFLSLAMAKRYAELMLMTDVEPGPRWGRGYDVGDMQLIQNLGGAAGYISILVLALYINSGSVRNLYSRPDVLWLLGPVLLYWISRIWLVSHRGQLHHDPIVFAIKDRPSYVVGIIALLIAAMATT